MKLLFAVLLSFFIIPFVSIATAENINSEIISFIQIVQRDNDGNLIGYLEYDHVDIHNYSNFEGLLNQLYDEKPRIVEVNGMDYVLAQVGTMISTDDSGLLSTTNLGVENTDGSLNIIMSVMNDGIRLAYDEKVTVYWTFLIPV